MEVDRHTIQQNLKFTRKMISHFKPSDCDNFERCNAPICPLDPDWRERVYLRDEPTCMHQKDLVRGSKRWGYSKLLLLEVGRQHPKIIAAYPTFFRKALE